MIENCVKGETGPDRNRETDFAYNADGRLKTLTAINSITGNQSTQYVYGTTLDDSDIASNDLLRAVIYPDSDDTASPLTNGTDGIYDHVEMKYNRLGEVREKKDQLETVHVLEYDKLDRLIHDRVTAFGTAVDQTIERISLAYEVRGMLQKVTSYDHATVGQGSVVNEVHFAYNGFGQLVTEYQSHSGTVDTDTTPKVQYAYGDGSANQIRPSSLTYPDGRVTTYDYGTTGGTDDLLSRICALKHGSTVMVEYGFLGLGTNVRASYTTQPGVELTYLKQSGESDGDAGDRYTGLDRFGRIVDQRWLKTSTGTALERVQYGFDRASNRQWRDNLVAASGQDEYYTYDGLYQLATLQRGDLNSNKTGISGTPAWEENFNYDPTGNWHGSTTAYLTKTSGTTDLDQNRTHNAANELTGITTNSGPAWVAPAHDRAGNMTTIPQPNAPTSSYTCTYDAWNRLVAVAAGGSSVATYQYDGQNRRTTKTIGSSTRHFYYSDQWQVLEERVDSASTAERQFIWGQRYIDDLVLRDRGTERLYVLHDAFHADAVTDTAGSVQQRYGYKAFGASRVLNPDWTTNPTPTDYAWETRYGSYRCDLESSLCQARHRYLHSALGRWINRDALEYADAVSLYTYVNSNPANAVDPTGEGVVDTVIQAAIALFWALLPFPCPCTTGGGYQYSGLQFTIVALTPTKKGGCPPLWIAKPLIHVLAPASGSGTIPATPCPEGKTCVAFTIFTYGPAKAKPANPKKSPARFTLPLPRYPFCHVTLDIDGVTLTIVLSIGTCETKK